MPGPKLPGRKPWNTWEPSRNTKPSASLPVSALKAGGYQVLQAKSPYEAIPLFEKSREEIDLILTDVVMPGMRGPQFIERLREKHPDIKVVFMSGYGEFHGRNKIPEDEKIGFLPKPFTPDALLQKIRTMLDRGDECDSQS